MIVRLLVKDKVSLFFVLSFIGYWFIALIVSCFNPYGLFPVSDFTYAILILNVTSFVFGFSFGRSKGFLSKTPFNIEKITNNYFFNTIVIIGIVCVLFLCIFKQQYMSFSEDSSARFRADFFEVLFEGNFLLLCAYYLFLFPLYYFLLTIVCYMLICKRNWKVALYALYLLPFMSLGEGRSEFFIAGLTLVLICVVCKEKSCLKIDFRTGLAVLLVCCTIFVGMVKVTSNRSEIDFNEASKQLSKTFITYSTGPFRLLDYAFNHDYINQAGGLKYGRASLCGLDFLIQRFFSRLGVEYEPVKYTTNDVLQTTWVQVGSEITYNYAYTNVIYHYYDFGIIGVLLFPAFFGLFCKSMIMKFYRLDNIFMLALISFLFLIAIQTPFSWYFNKLFTVPYILTLLIISNRKGEKIY